MEEMGETRWAKIQELNRAHAQNGRLLTDIKVMAYTFPAICIVMGALLLVARAFITFGGCNQAGKWILICEDPL